MKTRILRCARKRLLGLLSLCFVLTVTAWAQVQTGRIVGTVIDAQKAALPNATVTVTEAATNQTVTVTTNERGDFVVTPLNPGFYRVSVSSPGFQKSVINSVEVQVGQSARVDVEMKVGEVTSTVEVTSSAPLLDTESGTLGHVVTNTQIVNLPLNGRSFYELARLTPGAALLPGGGNLLRIRANFISGTAISGVRGRQTTFLMDGVDVTDHHQGGSLIQTSIDALQEFKVQQSAYSAEFSHAGGLLNGSTKSGANAFHGGLFEFLRNDKLDARNSPGLPLSGSSRTLSRRAVRRGCRSRSLRQTRNSWRRASALPGARLANGQCYPAVTAFSTKRRTRTAASITT